MKHFRHQRGYTSAQLWGFARERAAWTALLAYVLARDAWASWTRSRHPLRKLERETERALRQAEREGRRWAS